MVWQLDKGTVQEVCESLPPNRKISYATVQTLLRRLEGKGYLRHDIRGKAHVFLPAVRREHVLKRSIGDFLDRLFGGDPIPLIQYLAEHGKISSEELERLKKLADK